MTPIDHCESALRAADYAPTRDLSGEMLVVAVSDDDGATGDVELEALRTIAARHGCVADWSGHSESDDEGETSTVWIEARD